MDWIDYREQLGIGFENREKFSYFCNKLLNYLNLLASNDVLAYLSAEEYCKFCNITGSIIDIQLLEDYCYSNRFGHCLQILRKNATDLKIFLSYYVAFANSIKEGKQDYERWTRSDYIDIAQNMLKESHIPYDIIESDGQYFIFPKGAKELDDALVSQPLEWLSDYPTARVAWIKALKDYADVTLDNASDVADKLRKALERFFQEFFSGNKSLENYKIEYGTFLKDNNVPKEIRGNFETMLQAYANYINNYAKHTDKADINVLEYVLYQTGNIMRLLITLKQNKGEKE